jgi:hypothetical protein
MHRLLKVQVRTPFTEVQVLQLLVALDTVVGQANQAQLVQVQVMQNMRIQVQYYLNPLPHYLMLVFNWFLLED